MRLLSLPSATVARSLPAGGAAALYPAPEAVAVWGARSLSARGTRAHSAAMATLPAGHLSVVVVRREEAAKVQDRPNKLLNN